MGVKYIFAEYWNSPGITHTYTKFYRFIKKSICPEFPYFKRIYLIPESVMSEDHGFEIRTKDSCA